MTEKVKVDDSKIITIAYLISENMNDKEIFKMCMLLLICVFKGWK